MKNKTKAVLLTLLLVWGLTGCNVQNKEECLSGSSSVPDTSVEESIAESPASDFSFHEIDGRGIVYYHGNDEHVVIPAQIDGKPVTEIGRQAFYQYDKLVSVTIPSTVTTIENEAFNYCTNLKTVRLTSGLQKIGSNAFKNCISLSEITLPDTLTTIGDSAFSCCYDLKQVRLLYIRSMKRLLHRLLRLTSCDQRYPFRYPYSYRRSRLSIRVRYNPFLHKWEQPRYPYNYDLS